MPDPAPAHPEIRHSLLDRLLGMPDGRDPSARAPRNSRAERVVANLEEARRSGRRADATVDWVIAAVKEDLRRLLTTIRPRRPEPIAPGDPLHRSLLTYGVADFSHLTAGEIRGGDLLTRAVADAIERFEPRLAEVAVEFDRTHRSEHEVRLRIRAKLVLKPEEALAVSLDTVMSLSHRTVDVQGGPDGGEAG